MKLVTLLQSSSAPVTIGDGYPGTYAIWNEEGEVEEYSKYLRINNPSLSKWYREAVDYGNNVVVCANYDQNAYGTPIEDYGVGGVHCSTCPLKWEKGNLKCKLIYDLVGTAELESGRVADVRLSLSGTNEKIARELIEYEHNYDTYPLYVDLGSKHRKWRGNEWEAITIWIPSQ